RIAQEVARQTSQLRRTTKLLFGALILAFALFGFLQWQGGRERARDQRAIAQAQNQIQALQDALAQSHQEVSRIQSQLDTAARSNGSRAACWASRARWTSACSRWTSRAACRAWRASRARRKRCSAAIPSPSSGSRSAWISRWKAARE